MNPRAPLTNPQIEVLVDRYTREMTRYEETALLVERRLSRELRANAVRALLSSRAKHPEDLRGKLARKRGDERYEFSTLDAKLNEVITNLAGCRVMVYRFSDIKNIERVVADTFERADVEKNFERHDKKESGYRATHILVKVGDNEERQSLRRAICEVRDHLARLSCVQRARARHRL